MSDIIVPQEWLDDELERAEEKNQESQGEHPNSYGAGYDNGYLAALRKIKEGKFDE